MYHIVYTKSFSKSLQKIRNSVGGKKIVEELKILLDILITGEKIPEKYRDHQLRGDYREYREWHLRGDVLVVYKLEKDICIVTLVDIGSHSYLF